MSSYICSAEHFNAIQMNVVNQITHSSFHQFHLIKHLFTNKDLNKAKWNINRIVDRYMDELRRINVLTYHLQYKRNFEGKMDTEIQIKTDFLLNTKVTNNKYLTPHGTYNGLRCIQYQIELHHLEDIRDLTEEESKAIDFLNCMITAMAHHIVSLLPEDTTNQWSI